MKTFKRGNRFILLSLIYIIVIPKLIGLFEKIIFGKTFSNVFFTIFVYIITVVIPPLYFYLKNKDLEIPIGNLSIKEIIIIIMITLLIDPITSILNIISQIFVKSHTIELINSVQNENTFIFIFIIAILPAIFEELFTRAVIINTYTKQSVKLTILMSGLFFGIFHFNINQFLYAFVLGVIMCYIVIITESILSSMLMHFVINFQAVFWTKIFVFLQDNFTNMNFNFQISLHDKIQASKIMPSSILISISINLILILICTPLALYLLKIIAKGRNKQLKGSLDLKTYELANMNCPKEENVEENLDNNLENELYYSTYNKIFDGYLVGAIIIFILNGLH